MPTDHPAGHDGSTRPRVIVSVTATADGRVTLSRMERLLDDGPNRRWKATWPPDTEDLRTDFLPYRSPRWFAVVDSRGRVAWTYKGDEETSLLVIGSRSTPLP